MTIKNLAVLLMFFTALIAPSFLPAQIQPDSSDIVRQRIEQLEKEAESLPDDPYILSQLEKLYAASGMLEKSKAILENMIKLRPDDPSVYSELGYVLDALKEHDAALKYHLLAVKKGPDDPIVHINLALSYYYAGRISDSTAEFNNAIEINRRLLDTARQQHTFTPDEITSNINEQVFYLSNIALCYLFTNRPYKALEYLETARGFAPDDDNIASLLEKTRKSIEKGAASGIVTDEQQLAMRTARDLISRNDPARAIEIYRELAAAGVDSAELHINAGKAAFMLGQLEDAVSHYKRAAELDAENPIIFYNLGVIHVRLGDEESAYQTLTKAVQLNPDYVTALTVLGPIEARRKKFDDAEKHLSRAAQLDPRQQQPREELCSVYLQASRYRQAETFAREWLKDFPLSSEAPLCLATALNLSGEQRRARTILERALTINPSSEKLASLYHSIPELDLPPSIAGMPPIVHPSQKPPKQKKQTAKATTKKPATKTAVAAKPKKPSSKKPAAVAKAKKPAKQIKPAKAKPATAVASSQPATSTAPIIATSTTSVSTTSVAVSPAKKPQAAAKPVKPAVAKQKKPVAKKPATVAAAKKPTARKKPEKSPAVVVSKAPSSSQPGHIEHPSIPLPDASAAASNLPAPSRDTVSAETGSEKTDIGVEPITGLYKGANTRLAAIASPRLSAKKFITAAREKKVPAFAKRVIAAPAVKSQPGTAAQKPAKPAIKKEPVQTKRVEVAKQNNAQKPATATAPVTVPATASVAIVSPLPESGNVTNKKPIRTSAKLPEATKKQNKTATSAVKPEAPKTTKQTRISKKKTGAVATAAPQQSATATKVITEKQTGGGVVFKRVPATQAATATVAATQQPAAVAGTKPASAKKPAAVITVSSNVEKPAKPAKEKTKKTTPPAPVRPAKSEPAQTKLAGALPILPELADNIKDQVEAAGIAPPPGIAGFDPKTLLKLRSELSGKWLYVDRSETIWARKAGSMEFRRLAGGFQPSLTKDRRTMVFATREGSTRMVKAVDLSNLSAKALLDDKKFRRGAESAFFKQPAISTDGKYLSVLVESGGGIFDLVLRRLDTGTLMRPLPGYSIENYTWDPSGDRIYFYSDPCGKDSSGRTSCIGVVSVSTGAVSWIETVLPTPSGKRVFLGSISHPAFFLSPSGKRMLIYDNDMYNGSAIVIDLAAGSATKLTPTGIDGNEIDFEAIAWSPNEDRFAFITSNYLWVMDLDGKNAFPVQPLPGGVVPPFYWLP